MQPTVQANAVEERKVDKRNAKEELAEGGFIQDGAVRFLAWQWILLVGVVMIAAGFALNRWATTVFGAGITGGNLVTALFALLAAIVGYRQWQASRQETSLDRFYDRLKLTNDRLNEWAAARMMLNGQTIIAKDEEESPEAKQEWRRMMYVFIELDNLEYAIEKYRIGYMRPELARRALRTFRLRCTNEDFRTRARDRVRNTADLEYTTTTRDVVERVCELLGPGIPQRSR